MNSRPTLDLVTDSHSLRWLFYWMLGLGLAWRTLRWALAMPLWGDEVMLALNFLDRSGVELVYPLAMGQVAPPMFMLLNGLLFHLLGYSEWVLRLFPLVFGIVGLLLFYRFSLSVVRPNEALIAVATLAVSYFSVRHGSEFKPYSLDLAMAVALLSMAQYFRSHSESFLLSGGLIVIVGAAPFFSYPSIFISVTVVIGLGVEAIAHREIRRLIIVGATGLFALAIFAVNYKYIIAPQQESAVLLRGLWSDAFPPNGVFEFIGWFLRMSAGNMMAYPTGGKNFGSILTLGLVCVGILGLAQRKWWFLLWVLVMPLVFNLLASIFHIYPYGKSARIAQFLAPSICLLTGVGFVGLLEIFKATRPNIIIRWAVVLLSIFGIAGIAEAIIKPYKSKGDLHVRVLVEDEMPRKGCLRYRVVNTPQTVPVNFRWYLAIRGDTLFGRAALSVPTSLLEPICIWHFDPERHPKDLTKFVAWVSKESESKSVLKDMSGVAYIYGKKQHPHTFRIVVLQSETSVSEPM
jgi:hypothetical protein